MNVVVERLPDKVVLEPSYPGAKFWICSSGAALLAKAIVVTRHEPVVLVLTRRGAQTAARELLLSTGTQEGTHWWVRGSAA